MPGSSSGSETTPPSPPSSAAESQDGGEGRAHRAGSVFPLVLAGAAALSCWNLFGAPFAIVAAIGALALALRRERLRAGAARTRLRAAAALAIAALVVGVAVLFVTFRGAVGGAAVPGAPTPASKEAEKLLDDAERRTADQRGRARSELERADSSPAPTRTPAGGAVR